MTISDKQSNENKKEINLQKLSEELSTFAMVTVKGQLSGAYKSAIANKNITILKNFKQMYPYFCAKYLNRLYSSLIKLDDEYVINSFAKFRACSDHSEICLLHMIRSLCEGFVTLLNFEQLNYASYDKFMETSEVQLTAFANVSNEHLQNNLNHVCNGIDISTCDPNEKLFFIKTHEGKCNESCECANLNA